MSQNLLFFVCTTDRCRINGQPSPGIPIFFDESGIIRPASDFMVHLVHELRRPETTARTKAMHLQALLKRIAAKGISWTDVTDGVLIAWRDELLNRSRLAPGTVSAYLGTVFGFYRWAEESGRVRHVVNLYAGLHGLHPPPDERTYQISATRSRRGELYWPRLPGGSGGAVRHTPSHEEIEQVHIKVFETKTGERDSLLLSFYEDCYLRRSEALSLTVRDTPSWDEIESKSMAGEAFTLSVRGKGGRVRPVIVLPELMALAREHIEGDRARVVARAKRRNARYVDPGALFLSWTTGAVLTKDHVSARISKAILDAGVENASGHRLRASGLLALVAAHDGFDDSGKPLSVADVLWKAAERAGHKHWRTLEPYLRISRSAGTEPRVELRLRDHTRVAVLERRVAGLTSQRRARRAEASHR